MHGEVSAGLDAGVAVLPKLNEGAGIGIFQPRFTQVIEGSDSGFLRVGDEAVNGFLAVNVGLVFEVTAESVACRLEDEASNGEGEEEDDKTLAAGERG